MKKAIDEVFEEYKSLKFKRGGNGFIQGEIFKDQVDFEIIEKFIVNSLIKVLKELPKRKAHTPFDLPVEVIWPDDVKEIIEYIRKKI